MASRLPMLTAGKGEMVFRCSIQTASLSSNSARCLVTALTVPVPAQKTATTGETPSCAIHSAIPDVPLDAEQGTSFCSKSMPRFS